MRKKLRAILKIFLILGLICVSLYAMFILALLNEFVNRPPHLMLTVESESLIWNVTLLFPVYTYMNQSIELLECDGCSIEEVETKYGKMWKIRINKIGLTDEEIEELRRELQINDSSEIDSGGGVTFSQPYVPNQQPIDLFSIDLHPKLAYEERVSESGRYYVRTANITVPVCVHYEGNSVIRVRFVADSGFYAVLGLIPSSPKHDGRVYAGMREDTFDMDFKGCGNVTGVSKIDIVYQ